MGKLDGWGLQVRVRFLSLGPSLKSIESASRPSTTLRSRATPDRFLLRVGQFAFDPGAMGEVKIHERWRPGGAGSALLVGAWRHLWRV